MVVGTAERRRIEKINAAIGAAGDDDVFAIPLEDGRSRAGNFGAFLHGRGRAGWREVVLHCESLCIERNYRVGILARN